MTKNSTPHSKECYICKQAYDKTHHFYRDICNECGEKNYIKRIQQSDLVGYTALVTGGRIKIGYETALKLLRCGANVIVTTRFPNDTLLRYAKEKDFQKWKDRLNIYGLDMRLINSVEEFINTIIGKFQKINILINNAAQTVRKPPIFYKHLLSTELNDSAKITELKKLLNGDVYDMHKSLSPVIHHDINLLPSQTILKYNSSAELSQVQLLPGDEITESDFFPKNKFDKDGQQEDRRDVNSWMLELDEINLIEFYEVLNINLITPFLFNTRLKKTLINSGIPSFIINVTAMEGNFFAPRKKTRHPHTNMAKAALNMMTRTSAKSYAEFGIFMNSVDTGWITNEKPFYTYISPDERKTIMAIDEIDGAARILDPIFSAINEKNYSFGKLYKNYEEYPW